MRIVKNNNQNLSRTHSELVSIIIFGIGLGLMLAGSFLGSILLYLTQLSYKSLPYIVLYSGLTGFILSFAYSYLHKRFSISTLCTIFLSLFSIFYYYLFYQLSFSGNPQLYTAYAMIGLFPTLSILFSLYNAFGHSLFNIRENKKLSPIAIIGILFAIITLASVFPYILENTFLEVRHLFFTVSVSAILTIFSVWISALKFENINEIQLSAQYINYFNKFNKLIRNSYFLYLSVFTVCFTITLWLVDVLFLYTVEQSAKQEVELNQFISYSTLGLCFFAYLFLWVSQKKLVRQYGIKVSLLVLPILTILLISVAFAVGYFYGFEKAAISFIRFFIIIIAGTVLIHGLKFGIQNTLFKLYFSPIESSLRFDIQTTIDNMLRHITTFLTGLLLIGIVQLGTSNWFNSFFAELNQPYFPVLIMICIIFFSIGWILSIVFMYRMYKGLLEDNLGQQRNLIKHEQSLTQSFLSQLEQNIPNSEYEQAIFQLNLLKVLDPVIYRKIIVELAAHQNEHIQEVALYEVLNFHLLEALPAIQQVMSWKYFPALKTASLVREVNIKLNEALFRLEQVKYVDQLTSSKLVNERIYGALLAQHLDASEKGRVLNRLFGDTNEAVIYNAIIAAAKADDTSLHNNLILQLKRPEYSNAAVAAISASDDSFLKMLETAFQLNKQDQRTQQRILQIYGRISSESAVTALLNKLNYPNQNVVATCLDALSRCGFTVTDSSKALQVRTELEEVCNAMIWNMAVYIDAENNNCSNLLLRALEHEISTNYETVFRLLALIYDPRSVELVKININSNDVEESEFASDLLDIFINDEMKSFLIPIFKISSYRSKVEELMNIFPTEPMEKAEMLVNIVQRDYKWINSWTKTCALKDLSKETNFNSFEIMASHLVNPDPILRETAAQALFEIFPDAFDTLAKRYEKQREFHFAYETTEVIRKIKTEKSEVPALKFDMITFLNEIKEFSGISGLVLSEIIKRVTIQQHKKEEVIYRGEIENLDFYFIYKGEVQLSTRLKHIDYAPKQMIHNFQLNHHDHTPVQIKALTDVIVMKINRAVFLEMLSFYEEIPQSMLKQYKNEKQGKEYKMVLN